MVLKGSFACFAQTAGSSPGFEDDLSFSVLFQPQFRATTLAREAGRASGFEDGHSF